MRELIKDSFYEILKTYNRLVVDYCLMDKASSNQGYASHKEAILYAMQRLSEQYSWISIDIEKAIGNEISSESLFFFPNKLWKKTSHGTTLYSVNKEDGKIPYWYAFVAPPHGTGPVINNGNKVREEYGREDFEIINQTLFPQGTDELEIYTWSTDWSNYFDAGQEWWGTLCCSIYDKKLNRYVVLMASTTD